MPVKYKRRKASTIPPERRVKRICLKCDESFTAEGKYNRICEECDRQNEYIRDTHTEEALMYGGDGLPNAERYLLMGLK